MITLKNVSKALAGRSVLDNITFHLDRGESLALLGLSGSGKTTALKLICGLHSADAGEVIINGIQLTPESLKEIRQKLGYVIQDGGLFPHLTARENVMLLGKEAGLAEQKIDERVHELADLTQIPRHFLECYPRELSGGQRQRIGIMRALFHDPEILLLDEPLGALDPITRQELQSELKDLITRLKKTVVLVTHDLYEATYLADRIVLLSEGRIVQEGTMKELLDRPATDFVKKFIMAQKHHLADS